MGISMFFVLCSLTGCLALSKVILHADRPFLRVRFMDPAFLKCCYEGVPSNLIWYRQNDSSKAHLVTILDRVEEKYSKNENVHCSNLTFKFVLLEDIGMYQCLLNDTGVLTHGTYMQVYKPMEKTINLSENTKNTILTVEGFLLLLCVLLPSATLLLKSRSLERLEMKKVRQEEENIYQGLNLDDCCTTYDQIERSQAQGPYQDVGNIVEEKEEIQLEKP
ncbi:B-cell antigen receptor complex-associated protein alpha chain [Odontesthes bonariensis]|uniref:B-cell antigen receptor complex-associated protein alpha chain n=1 Tax=Odontesthes bonariensis TaxID=219752 RepID=UPI003F588E1F